MGIQTSKASGFLPASFSDEEMVRDWTLSQSDKTEVGKYRKSHRLLIAVQLCAVRLYGRFLQEPHDVSPRISTYLSTQLGLAPTLHFTIPAREKTQRTWHQRILSYLGFRRFDAELQDQLQAWIIQEAQVGSLPQHLIEQAGQYILNQKALLPGRSTIELNVS